MLTLAIESATDEVGCALVDGSGLVAEVRLARGRRHAETLTPSIQFVCEQAGVDLSTVSVVAVDVGPGLFTGLRVGIATAKALAASMAVPMVGMSSLDLLAFPVRFSARKVGAVVDARRGEVFVAWYRQVPGGMQRLAEPTVCTPDDLMADLQASADEQLLVGDGALRYADLFTEIDRVEVGDVSLARPSVAALGHLARAQALREEWTRPHDLAPLYLRPPDAEINWGTRDEVRR